MIDFSEAVEAYIEIIKDDLRASGATDDELNWLLSENGDNEETDELYDDILREVAKLILDNANENLDKRDKKEKNERMQTRRRFGIIWGKGFAWMRQFHSLSLETCESFRVIANKNPQIVNNPNTYKALYLIFARAILVYSEVICLMENGFPDGAFAHYRTLYELWAVAELIYSDEDAEVVASTYLQSANKISTDEAGHYKWAKSSKRFENSANVTISAIVKKAHETCMLKREQGRSNKKMMGDYTFPNTLIHPAAIGLEILSNSFPNAKTVGMTNPAINASLRLYEISSLYTFMFAEALSDDETTQFYDDAFICNEMLREMVWEKIWPIFNEIEHGDQNEKERRADLDG